MTERPLEDLRVGLAQIDCPPGRRRAQPGAPPRVDRRGARRGGRAAALPRALAHRLPAAPPDAAGRAPARRRSPVIAPAAEAAPEMAVVVGCVEEDERGFAATTARCCSPAARSPTSTASSTCRPTASSRRGASSARGAGSRAGDAFGNPFGVLICEDFWHSDPAERLARAGAKLIARRLGLARAASAPTRCRRRRRPGSR